MIGVEDYVNRIKEAYTEAGDPLRAQRQMDYMRNHFEFYGLAAPTWVAMLRTIFKEQGLYRGEELYDFVRLCLDDVYREGPLRRATNAREMCAWA